ncbi:hypothetical protein ACSBR2_025466 [Camellia fascicularis]
MLSQNQNPQSHQDHHNKNLIHSKRSLSAGPSLQQSPSSRLARVGCAHRPSPRRPYLQGSNRIRVCTESPERR